MDCAWSRRLGRLARAAALVLLVAGLVGGVAWQRSGNAKAAQYGAQATRVLALKEHLAKEPCDVSAAVKLGDLLIQAGVSREVAPMADAFKARCGRHETLLWKDYAAAKRMGQSDRAIAIATDLIEHNPADKDYWWWRGIVYEQRDELARALADYKQALAIRPDLSAVPFNVADVYERLKRPCDAALTIEQYMHWHPRTRGDRGLRLRLQRLYREGRCEETARGTAEIRFDPLSRSIVVSARVNGTHGRFILDTGASLVALSREFAGQAGVEGSSGAPIRVRTANGVSLARLTRVDALALQGATAEGVEAAVMDGLPEHVDGLIGLSFLARFDLHLDMDGGLVSLSARRG